MTEKTGHRWSGWPGAWCLDCGCPDPFEMALADNNLEMEGEEAFIPEHIRHLYPPDECPEPGSRRNDPYCSQTEDESQ